MLNTPPHLEARDPRGFVSIFHGTSSSVARRRLRASDLSFWQSMPSFDIGRPGLHLQSGASVVFGGRARENSFAEAWEFQSARPVWGATRGREFASLYTVDFNPRAPCGARRDERHYHHQGKHFNPRAPCGARLSGLSSATCHQHFNPRAPCGARLPLDMLLSCAALFQSTRPVWGATHKCNLVHPVQVISIHAPRVGRDRIGERAGAESDHFNPRAPCGARQDDNLTINIVRDFNPRAPCGARRPKSKSLLTHQNFNPRAPCGARPG